MGKEGKENTDAETAEDMKNDNMSYCSLKDFPYDSKIVRGVLSSLIKKRLVCFEKGAFSRPDQFSLSDAGVDKYFENREGA